MFPHSVQMKTEAAESKSSERGSEMEFWEGAILVVGGIWLIGKLSRQSPNHPVNAIPLSVSASGNSLNPTLSTNTDGSSSLVVGEPFGPGATPTTIGGSSSAPACCGQNAATTPATVGASTGTPRTPAATSTPNKILPFNAARPGAFINQFKGRTPVPVRQLPANQVPVRTTATSPAAAAAPRQPVRFYAV
jgi:hypothetical protein